MLKNKFFILAAGITFLGGCHVPSQQETARDILEKVKGMQKEKTLSSHQKKAKNARLFYQKLTKEVVEILSITWNAVLAYQEYDENHKLAKLTEEMQSIGFFLTSIGQSFTIVGKEAKGKWTLADYKKKVQDSLVQELEVSRKLKEELLISDKSKKMSLKEKEEIIKQYVSVIVGRAKHHITPKKTNKITG